MALLIVLGLVVFTIWFAGLCLLIFAKIESKWFFIGRLFFAFGILALAVFAAVVLVESCSLDDFGSSPSLF